MGWDSQGKIDKAASIDVNVFKYGDKLISINQQRIDWNDLLPNGFPRVLGEARLNKGVNRPQFSRHSTAAFRTALHTLPAIAGY